MNCFTPKYFSHKTNVKYIERKCGKITETQAIFTLKRVGVDHYKKIASLGRQEPQPAGTGKWPMTLRFGKILGTTSVVRSIEDPQDVLQKIYRP